MRKTPLYDTHVALGGRMVEFAGYGLPVQYPTGPNVEHQAVRTAAGLFDIDHMAQFSLSGSDAEAYLQKMQVYDVAQMKPWDAHYSLLCYDDGTIVDDIFVYRLPDSWFIAVNASNREKDFAWMQAHTLGYDLSLIDISDETCMLALQGPHAEKILQKLVPADLNAVATRTAVSTTLCGQPALLGRTGYTGEDGFELFFPAEAAVETWNALLEAGREDGLLPCGLASRDSLRFEACMPLYGHELSSSISALEARMNWTIGWNKEFIGRSALLKEKAEGPKRLIVGLEMVDKAVAREHYEVASGGREVGFVSSGMKSPTLDKFLGMAYVPAELAANGTEVDVIIRGQPRKAVVVKRPFYKPHYK